MVETRLCSTAPLTFLMDLPKGKEDRGAPLPSASGLLVTAD